MANQFDNKGLPVARNTPRMPRVNAPAKDGQVVITHELSEDDVEAIALSLNLRCGFIETGSGLRAVDAIRSGQEKKLKQMDDHQRAMVVNMDRLAQDLRQKISDARMSRIKEKVRQPGDFPRVATKPRFARRPG